MQQIILEKEAELSRMRQTTADVTRQQEEEARNDLLHIVESLEMELERTTQESKIAMRQVESDAEATIDKAMKEIQREMEQRENEIYHASQSKLNKEWSLREECVRNEADAILSSGLEKQHCQLTSHYNDIIEEQNKVTNAREDELKLQIRTLQDDHQHHVEEMQKEMDMIAEEIWNDACEQFGLAADEKISQAIAVVDEQCKARDEQISMLQNALDKKESLLDQRTKDLNKMENTLKESTSDLHSRHEKHMALLTEEATRIALDNEQLQQALHEVSLENDSLERELIQCRSDVKALETKCADQKGTINTSENEKQRLESRIGELSAREQLLERQLLDMKKENTMLETSSELLKKKIDTLIQTKEELSGKVLTLTNHVDQLKEKNHILEGKHNDTISHVKSLEQDKHEYIRETEYRLKQKDNLLAETLANLNSTASKTRSVEPVVVHLHGNTNDNKNSNRNDGNERLSIECNRLRSKVLQLQRENFRLENEVMGTRNAKANDKKDDSRVEALQRENNSLKTVVSMLRQEMEIAAAADKTSGDNTEQNNGSKFSSVDHYPTTTAREQELIQKLEEATDEIESLLRENKKLMMLSNELRFELQRERSKSPLVSHLYDDRQDETTGREKCHDDQSVLDAVLNDQSRSNCDNESQDTPEVACIGSKPPLSSRVDYLPSKTAYVSIRSVPLLLFLVIFSISTLLFDLYTYLNRGPDRTRHRIEPQTAKNNH